MKFLPLLLLMCSMAWARPAPPPQVIYVTNYVFGVVTNYVNTTNHINWTNTINTFTYVTTTNWVTNFQTISVTNTLVQPLTNAVFYDSLTVKGSGPGSVQTFSGTNLTGHLP